MIAYEQLEKVKRGELPSIEGKDLIGQISQLECLHGKLDKNGRDLENIK